MVNKEDLRGGLIMSLENKLEFDKVDVFFGKCKNCNGKRVGFYYIGSMGEEVGKKIELYNCPECNSTYSKKTIIQYNEEK